MQDLIRFATSFEKQAGIFEAPPRMVERLYDKGRKLYAQVVLWHLWQNEQYKRSFLSFKDPRSITKEEFKKDDEERYNEYKKLVDIASNTGVIPLKPRTITFELPIDLQGWKYFTPKLYDAFLNAPTYHRPVRCIFNFYSKDSEGNPLGMHDNISNTIWINITYTNPENVSRFDHELFQLYQTVRHELQHFAQFLLSDLLYDPLTSQGPLAGTLGRKLRSKEHDVLGIHHRTKEQLEHSLQDIEFQTNLADSIDNFILHKEKFPSELHKDFARSWVGLPNDFYAKMFNKIMRSNISPDHKQKYLSYLINISKPSPPFDVLIKKDPNKWKKAVSVFYSQVF